jgi:DNA-binding transcriptional LysR family regulator
MSDVGEMVFLPALIKRLRELRASVQIETAQMDSNDVEVRLASGEIDFALGYLPALNKPIKKTRLFKEHYVCMTRKDESASGKTKLSLKQFLDVSHVQIASMGSGHQIIERTLDRRGLKRSIALRVPHFLVIPNIIAGTDLIATLPSRVANAFTHQARLQVQPLPVSIPSFDVSLFWHPRFSNDPPIQWLHNLLIELFQETSTRLKVAK